MSYDLPAITLSPVESSVNAHRLLPPPSNTALVRANCLTVTTGRQVPRRDCLCGELASWMHARTVRSAACCTYAPRPTNQPLQTALQCGIGMHRHHRHHAACQYHHLQRRVLYGVRDRVATWAPRGRPTAYLGSDEAVAERHADGFVQQGVAVGAGRCQHRQHPAADQALAGARPAAAGTGSRRRLRRQRRAVPCRLLLQLPTYYEGKRPRQ